MPSKDVNACRDISISFLKKLPLQELTEFEKKLIAAAATDKDPDVLSCDEYKKVEPYFGNKCEDKWIALSTYLMHRMRSVFMNKKLSVGASDPKDYCVPSNSVNEPVQGQSDSEILQTACGLYADNWIGLAYHYPKGKEDFLQLCTDSIAGKSLLSGLWAIRRLLPDGHAGFIVKSDGKPMMFPIVMQYDPYKRSVKIAASFEDAFNKYVGRKVISINGEPVLNVLEARAALEPQSTYESSMEIAARTITYSLQIRPYPDFPKQLSLKLEDGETIILHQEEIRPLKDQHDFRFGNNGYPSIWGDKKLKDDASICKSKNELSKIIEYKGKKWLWWHPLGMSFDTNKLNEVFYCWDSREEKISGVIADLRDTGGGHLKQPLIVNHFLGGKTEWNLSRLMSSGQASLQTSGTLPKGLKKTNKGYSYSHSLDLLEYENNLGFQAEKWDGRVIFITNGICGSACDFLAWNLAQGAKMCSYGTPTAGRTFAMFDVHLSNTVSIDIPLRETFTESGARWEGKPFIPKYKGTGGPEDAIDKCFP